jgi:hypothetical protein
VPVKAVMPECEPAMAEAAAVDNMRAAKPAAMKRRAATMETSAVEAAAAMTTAVTTTTVATSTAMAAADFGREVAGDVLRGRRRTRIDQRKCLRALTGRGR